MWKDVLATFRCVVKALKTVPGVAIEDIFGDVSAADLEKEYQFLVEKAKADGEIINHV